MNQFLDEKQKKQLLGAVLGVLGFLAIFLGVKAINAIKDFSYIGKGVYPSSTVTVTGTGEVTAVPDVASFSFSVTESSKQVSDAQNKSSQKINKIIEALKDMGILEKDIKTTGYNTYPKYDYVKIPCSESAMDLYPCQNSKQVLNGYEVSQTIIVKVRKTADAGTALSKVGDLGATNISGLSFVIDDMEKVQAEARNKAIKDAKEKAKVLEKSLGVRFARITSFYENGSHPVYGYGGDMMSEKVMSSQPLSVPPQVPVGENKVISNVSITYEIR